MSPETRSTGLRRWLLPTIVLVLPGCERAMHDMYQQPKYAPLAASSQWPDGRASRPLPAGVVAFSGGSAAESSSGRLGATPASAPAFADYRAAALERGRTRYDIYCLPCHGVTGAGDGYVVTRGYPAPASFDSQEARDLSDQALYELIRGGTGKMAGYAELIGPADCGAIAGYVRVLQLAQHAGLEDVPGDQRARLEALRP